MGTEGNFSGFDSANPEVITSDAELEAFEASVGIVVDHELDFNTQVLLISSVSSGSTCGTDGPVVHVVSIDGAPHLSVELTNPDALCSGTICDMAVSASQLVVVDKVEDAPATACARLVETCGS